MKKSAWLVTAAAVLVAAAGFAVLHVFGGNGPQARASTSEPAAAGTATASAAPSAKPGTTDKSYALTAGGRNRSYQVIAPAKPLPKSAPIIIALSGYGATNAEEISRDQLVPYVQTGQAELIYPVAVEKSWNAVGCCDYASAHHVNDIAFLKAIVAKVDPGRTRPIDVMGYSNGARLAYRIACTDPTLFDAYAMVKGVPMPGCNVTKAVDLIQVASTDDPEIPYKPGDHGLEALPVTTLMSQLRKSEGCPAASTTTEDQQLTLTSWSGCNGKRLQLAAWSTGVHAFPRPPGCNPGASPVIWAFFTQTKLAALPKA